MVGTGRFELPQGCCAAPLAIFIWRIRYAATFDIGVVVVGCKNSVPMNTEYLW
jgi:hypothetical protein